MSTGALDISWALLRDIVRDWAGGDAELDEVRPLHGGYVNTTVSLHCADGARAVLKITPHRIDRAYEDEAAQLGMLRKAGVPVPEVYRRVTGTLDHPYSYLLMEHVDGVDLIEARRSASAEGYDALQAELAEFVRALHGHVGESYGRVSSSGGEPVRYDTWATCYRDWFGPIWREVEKLNALTPKCRKTIGKVHDRLDRLLAHDDRPRLTHWDLWATNVLAKADTGGDWHVAAFLDPACRFAHCEAELAYLELFQTCNAAFLRAYQQPNRLSNDYFRIRRPVYQLYATINQLHCHGPTPDHVRQMGEAIERVQSVV
jgi:fructosamine-3-kinase